MRIATTVAVVTSKRLRALMDTSRSSRANTMPPSGALNVAAIPAPAPAAISVTRSPVRIGISDAQRRAEGRANLDDRPFASHRPAAADRDRRGQRLDHRDPRSDPALVVVNGVHDLGDAVPFGFGREILDQPRHHQCPGDGHKHHTDAPRAAERMHVGVIVRIQTDRGRARCGQSRSTCENPRHRNRRQLLRRSP